MVPLSVRHNKPGLSRRKRYFTVAFFDQPYFYDNKRRLPDKEKNRAIRKINGQVFYKTYNKVCCTSLGSFQQLFYQCFGIRNKAVSKFHQYLLLYRRNSKRSFFFAIPRKNNMCYFLCSYFF